MSTNSTISIARKDGTFSTVYCHWDGYKDGVGSTLAKYYTDESKVEELIALGSISSLGQEVSGSDEHSFDTPDSGVTVAYHRDRGDRYEMDDSSSVEELFDVISDYGIFWNYLFIDGRWVMITEKVDN